MVRCENCRFFKSHYDPTMKWWGQDTGECYRFPPLGKLHVIGRGMISDGCHVEKDHWCGEYKEIAE